MPSSPDDNRKQDRTPLVLAILVVAVALIAVWFSSSPKPNLEGAKTKRNEPLGKQAETAAHKDPVVKANGRDWIVGLVTGTDYQGSDVLKGVEEVKKRYGDAEKGGNIKHLTYPDNFFADLDASIAIIESLANDPLVRVIIVLEGIPGTTEAFKRIREKRPDIFLFVGEAHEDTEFIASAADMVVNADFIARGYLVPYGAKKLGAKTFVLVSFPRHMIDESLSRTRDIMEMACEDLGLRFVYENAPDPTAQTGVEFAQDFIRERIPQWLLKYGPDTAFYTTNNAHTAPMIAGVINNGGYFVEADESSPLMGYPEALDLDVSQMTDDWGQIVQAIETRIVAKNAGGRLGSWVSSLNQSHVVALVEFGRLVVDGKVEKDDTSALLKCYDNVNPKVKWNGGLYTDSSLRAIKNVFLIYQDSYIFGQGFLGLTEVFVPIKYKTVRKSDLSHPARDSFHIALITGVEDQGADDLVVAMDMIDRYGSAENGGLIHHEVYPDEFLANEEAMANLIEKMAEDPKTRVIIVNQAIPGTAEGFRRVRLKRPDIFRLAGEPFESPELISANSDLSVAGDFVARGYLIPYAAKMLGADSLVHVSFPRHLAYETVALQRKVMTVACDDLGLKFFQEIAPDPVAEDVGVEAAQNFIMENYPKWVEKYGKKAAFFPTNDAHTGPILRQMAKYGGYFVEGDIPSPMTGYPWAFDIDLQPYLGQWNKVLEVLEKSVNEAGASERMGVWVYPLSYTQTAGLVEFGKLLAEGKTEVTDIQAFLVCLGLNTPGARWNGSFLNDPTTGKPMRNYFLVYEDTYILGRGYIETTKVDVPEKFFSFKLGDH
ncbi:MAG: DUF3798 domain-containing protein [Deltaproteobacteria bacterium]|jgi:hypothetical protein|nr:DUF3798 domain-containing protein [Deltaproteobacteria bacterium]